MASQHAGFSAELSTALLDRRGRACLKAQMCPQEDNQISLFSVFNVAVWQVLVMLCHTDLCGLVSVVCISLTERSLCLYTHQELNLTCCTGLFKIYFPGVRMATLSDTEIIPSIKSPCGEVCQSYVIVKKTPQVLLQLMSKPLITALYVTNSDKLFLWQTLLRKVSQLFKQLPGIQPISYPLQNEMAPTLIFSETDVMGRSNAQATSYCKYSYFMAVIKSHCPNTWNSGCVCI